MYSVCEASNRVDNLIRIEVLEGLLNRDVVVSFSTGDSTATGI